MDDENDSYDAAVEWALVHGIDPEEYLKDLLGSVRYRRLRSEADERDDNETLGNA